MNYKIQQVVYSSSMLRAYTKFSLPFLLGNLLLK